MAAQPFQCFRQPRSRNHLSAIGFNIAVVIPRRDIGSGEHAHGLSETDPALCRGVLDLAEALDHALQSLPVNFNPAPANQRKPIGLSQQSLDFSRGQRLAIQHNLHSEVEEGILAKL